MKTTNTDRRTARTETLSRCTSKGRLYATLGRTERQLFDEIASMVSRREHHECWRAAQNEYGKTLAARRAA